MPKKIIALFTILFLVGCTKDVVQPTPPADEPPVVVTPLPGPDPKPTPLPTPSKPVMSVVDIVKSSPACTGYSWKSRGVAPIGYVKGVATSYQRALCRYKSAEKTPAGVMGQALGDPSKDMLALYGKDAATGAERLKKNFTLLIGLGMRESSGNYGEGRDLSANNVAAETAESGLYQFSYNLHSASPMLEVLYAEYQKKPEMCLEPMFKEGVKKAFNNNYSIDLKAKNQEYQQKGLAFQKFTRKCPAFAAEYMAVGGRVRVAHWGPLKRKEAEYKVECEQMLTKIEANTICAL